MLISKGMACTLLQSYFMSMRTVQGASGILLCVGTPPTDAEADTITAASSIVTNNLAATFNTTGMSYALNNTTEFPPRYVLTQYPTANSVNSVKAGTINWGLLINAAWGVAVVDVTGPNGGGVIEINTPNVVVGTPVSITNWSFKVGR